ncbi:alpha/beta hydrolase [Patulibacter sp.]|uniref:alpha/beta hydrolase n=1 Tax=Patulibacter sp. TaxID=1912859 RepID=UPI00271CDF9F|nr:alpha/beta fold hydrolase [Patulibacter sp.]MDO9407518.1 alpha/beta fold hydrolase [Patulibacter sp.]
MSNGRRPAHPADIHASTGPRAAAHGPATLGTAPLVLVPGAWTTGAAFHDVRDDLEAHGHRTRIVDLPAHGRRLPQLDRGGLAAIDRTLAEAIEACDAPPVLVGHSLGGLACLRAAGRHELAGLVLLMPAPPTGLVRSMLGGALRRPVNSVGLLGAALSMRVVTRLSRSRPAGLYSSDVTAATLRRAQAFRADESWVVLASLLLGSREPVRPSTVPTLVVGGTQDLTTPTPLVRRLAEDLRAEYVEVDVAHAFNEEPTHPLVTAVVLDFLDAQVA